MSIAAMNWAWLIFLSPTQKLVLMSLADNADDEGVCWPSIATIARKCSISERTAQRVVAELIRKGLLYSHARYKSDGSRTSNKYKLSLVVPHDKLSPPSVADVAPPRHAHVVPHDNDDVVTTNITIIEPQLPVKISTVDADTPGHKIEFYYPKQLSSEEREVARPQLDSIDPILAQAVLDELAARLNANKVTGAPLSYLRSLTSRAKAGQFMPEAGIRVAAAREQAKLEQIKKLAEVIKPSNPSEIPKHLAAMHQVLARKSTSNLNPED
jgi:hypothetical protein